MISNTRLEKILINSKSITIGEIESIVKELQKLRAERFINDPASVSSEGQCLHRPWDAVYYTDNDCNEHKTCMKCGIIVY